MTDISNFPNLSHSEFAEACHLLDSRYRRATLGPLRKRWKLNVCTALDTSFSHENDGYTTYVQIIRPLEGDVDLPFDLGSFSLSDTSAEGLQGDAELMETEESDKVWTVWYLNSVRRCTCFDPNWVYVYIARPPYPKRPS